MKINNFHILAIVNGVLIALLTADTIGMSAYLKAFLVTLVMYVLPGMSWMGLLKKHVTGTIFYLFYQLILSAGALILVHWGFLMLNQVPSPQSMLLALLAFCNLGVLLTKPANVIVSLGFDAKRFAILALSLVCMYTCLFAGMRHFPGQIDLDGEHQGTAYGIIHEFKPYLTSDIIPSPFYFAHPPLSNIWNAYSTLLMGNLEDYRYFYDRAKDTEKMLRLRPGEEMPVTIGDESGWLIYIQGQSYVFRTLWDNDVLDRPFSRQRLIEYISMQDQNRFFENPRPFPARVSNIFASLISVCLLFLWITRLTNSRLLGIVSGFVYVFSPGIFVRSCFSEHVAFTNMILIVLAYQACFPRDFEGSGKLGKLLAYIPGIVAGLINQKVVIMVLPLFIIQMVGALRSKEKQSIVQYVLQQMPICVGFAAGMILFWIYALIIDPNAFFLSHLRVHLFDRLLHINTMFAEDYPSLAQLWYQFNYEFPAFLLCIFGLLYSLKQGVDRHVLLLGAWFATGALLFSLVDWKQTNHLTQLIIPLLGVLMMYIEKQPMTYKRVLKVLVGLCMLYGFWFNVQLLANFQFYRPISGW